MQTTIRKINNIIEDIVLDHKVLNSFGEGDPFMINAKEYVMPIAWIDFGNVVLTRNQADVTVRLFVLDVPDREDVQKLDIKSDTLLMINDIVTMIRDNDELITRDFNFTVLPIEDERNDRLTGWYTDLILEVENIYGACDVPTN